jgi:hypothetical protein
MLGAQGLWAGRNLYPATPTVTRGLGFSGLIRRAAPFSRLLWHTRGFGGPILTRILTEKYKQGVYKMGVQYVDSRPEVCQFRNFKDIINSFPGWSSRFLQLICDRGWQPVFTNLSSKGSNGNTWILLFPRGSNRRVAVKNPRRSRPLLSGAVKVFDLVYGYLWGPEHHKRVLSL